MNIKNTLIYTILFFIIACQKESITISNDADDHFFLKNDGAEMTVFVKGNTSSNIFVVYLHGGPGGGSIASDECDIYKKIEATAAVVYWDQRSAGNSQGNYIKLSGEKYVNDLHKLISVLKCRYGADISIFLLGSSWGGTLALSYLITTDYQNGIKGCILSGAIFNFPALPNAQLEMIKNCASQQIALNYQVIEWNNLINNMSKNSASNATEFMEHNGLAYQAEILMTNVDSVIPLNVSNNAYVNYFLFSNNQPISGLFNEAQTDKIMWEELIKYDLTDRIGSITIPLALYWGKYDFVSTNTMADSLFTIIKTSNKELIYYLHSGHGVPGDADLIKYNQDVISFLNKYNQ